MNDNKKRILALIEILRRYSNSEKHLNLNEINDYLTNDYQIKDSTRKTLYDDFKTLNNFGYNIEYDKGYYLLEAPFNTSEIKIIQDSLDSLKNLDKRFLNELNDKLYAFISDDEKKLLEQLRNNSPHQQTKLLQHMENILEAIDKHLMLKITRKNNKKEEIYPLFLYRANDYYYFYYHYENSEKIYHFRFDNISDLILSDKKDLISIPYSTIRETIEASSSAFYKEKAQSLRLKLLDNYELTERLLLEDFPNAKRTKEGFIIKVSINDSLFARLSKYKNNIAIIDEDVARNYKEYLQSIIDVN